MDTTRPDSIEFHLTGQPLWDRMNRAVERIQERLEKTVRALEAAAIPYAVIGGNAVRAWVAQADEAAVRTTRDVDILLRRADFEAAKAALHQVGFHYKNVFGVDCFLDGPDANPRDAVHVVFANEKVRDTDLVASPDVSDSLGINQHNTLTLESLVRMKLNAFRRKDQMHLLDMLDVRLIDATWVDRYPTELAARLQELIDNPE